ncbi:adenylate cyclase [Halarchaeum acidiphilum MH1-52-1]|uniref:Adenylate cyclase n=1 Tax=Halarchaeum acidiphilum MH1-52-1 TaxID=1261545 RepID=U3ADQ0_9EURY|nr:class IV adenylate cyclase [Halarchaeum acidiphilum]GAD52888.1 adenylate cyclase [Halarchaeum acidiphilum MH1-52-1]
MYEVEVKVPADHGDVRDALESVGAEEGETVEQVDTYYDAPHRDFAETDEALRVRRVIDGDGERARITYKGPKVDSESKAREEIETGVADGEDAGAIFEGVGFTPAATVEKTRTYFTYDGYTVVLDDVAGLGQFVEVERESEDVASAREGAFDVLRRLGLDPTEQIRTSYLGLLLD